MILSRYVARRFFRSFLLVAGVMAGILLLVDMVEQLRSFSGEALTLAGAAHLASLRLPASLYEVLPLVVMLATLALFIGLARSSELVVARGAGRSALHVVAAPVVVAALIGVVAVAGLNPIVAAMAQRYDLRAAGLSGDDTSILSVSREGLWLREGAASSQRVINAASASSGGAMLHDVTILSFDAEARPEVRIEARSARLAEGMWHLTQVKVWPLTAANPEREAQARAAMSLPTTLSPARIRESFAAPDAISIWDLPGFIAALDNAGLSARAHRVWLQMELALPLFLVAMVLVGAGFTMRHFRAGNRGLLVMGALLCGFAAFFLRNFAQVLGVNGQIPVALAAWSPPLVAVLLAFALLLHLEEG